MKVDCCAFSPSKQPATMALKPDQRLASRVAQLVTDDGLVHVSDVQMHLKSFVSVEIFGGQTPPPSTDRRFFPTDKDVYNMIYR